MVLVVSWFPTGRLGRSRSCRRWAKGWSWFQRPCDKASCRDACLTDVVHLLNRSMKAGATDEQAGREVIDALEAVRARCRQRGIQADGAEISRAVRSRVEAKYKKKKDVVFQFMARPPAAAPDR